MFEELEKYVNNDHFFLTNHNRLEKVCNAPKNGVGIYIVYALADGEIELVYIGSSGKLRIDGSLKVREGGIYDRIVNSKQFDDKRRFSWQSQMKKENIEALDIYWYETFNEDTEDIPSFVESLIMQIHFDIYGKLPRWNLEY